MPFGTQSMKDVCSLITTGCAGISINKKFQRVRSIWSMTMVKRSILFFSE